MKIDFFGGSFQTSNKTILLPLLLNEGMNSSLQARNCLLFRS